MVPHFLRAIVFLLVATGSGMLFPASVAASPAAGNPLRIGVIIPLSGPFAVFGEGIRVGIELGRATEKNDSIEFIYEDSAYDPKQAIVAFEKLTSGDRVEAIIVMGSPTTGAVLPVAEAKGIPVFAWTPSRRVTEGHQNIMRLMSSADAQGAKMSTEMQRRGYTNVAVITAENEYCETVLNGFLTSADPHLIGLQEKIQSNDLDFRALLTRIRTANPGAIALCITTPQNSPFAKQARQLGIAVPIFGCHMMSSQEILDSAGNVLEGAWFVEGLVDPEFFKSFLTKTKDTSGLWLAAAHYDLVRMIGRLHREGIAAQAIMRKLLGMCMAKSGFDSNCVKEDNGVLYFDVSLGVTEIRGSSFVRRTM